MSSIATAPVEKFKPSIAHQHLKAPSPSRRGLRRAQAGSNLLRRAVAVLDSLADDAATPSVRAIAARTGLSMSAVQRIHDDLESLAPAVQAPVSRRYRLGPCTLALGAAHQRGLSLRAAALGPMSW